MKPVINYLRQHMFVIVIMTLAVMGFIGYQILTQHPVTQYADIEAETIQQLTELTSTYKEDEKELHDRLKNEASSQEWIVTGNVNLNEFSQTAMLLRGILANSRVVIQSQTNPSSQESSAHYNVQLQRTSLLEGDFYQNSNYTAVKLPFYANSLGIKNDKLGQWLDRTGYETAFSEVPSTVDVDRNFSFSLKDYLSFLKRLSEYETTVDENVVFRGETFQHFQLSITKEQAEDLMDEIVQAFKDNKDDANYVGKQMNQLNQLSFPNGLSYEAFYNDESVVSRSLNGDVVKEGRVNHFKLQVNTELNDKEYKLNSTLEVSGEQSIETSYLSQGQPKGQGYQVYNTFTMDQNGEADVRVKWDTLYESDSKDVDFELYAPAFLPRVEGNLVSKTNINNNQASQSLEWLIKMRQYQTTLSIDRDIHFSDEVEINKIQAQDTTFLHQLSNDENKQIIQELKQSFTTYIENLMDQFNPF